jgi:uncharacterized protein (TIGR00255 family)
MTGQGAAYLRRDGSTVTVEVRTVNSRYFKLSVRTSEGFASLEPRIDEVVRSFVRRGTVQVDVRIEHDVAPENFRLNEQVLAAYQRQLKAIGQHLDLDSSVQLTSLLLLPGVVEERALTAADADAQWPVMNQALVQALEHLTRMRAEEGEAMKVDLLENCRTITAQLDAIEARAPQVADNYRTRLRERLNRLLAEFDLQVESADVIREVGLFAERSDISEEVVRLRSHLEQFRTISESQDGGGRKLDFVTQEMFREANTVGSKANDADIARHVIEIKAAVERIREMVQNVE